MRWSIVRTIWLRELRDQLRDRRTIVMIAVLPLLLYPLLGVGLAQVAGAFRGRPRVVGIVGSENLPAGPSAGPAQLVLPWLAVPSSPCPHWGPGSPSPRTACSPIPPC
jgi:sodium transport system permease protein